jgi:hypothetical protein
LPKDPTLASPSKKKMRKPHDKQDDKPMSKCNEDSIEVVWVTHPGIKSDSTWFLEEEVMKQESTNNSDEESEAGTKETLEGPDQTGNFLMDDS